MKFNTYYAVLCGIIHTMKSIIKRILILLVLGGIFMPAFAAENKNQYVQVGSAQVKAKASQTSKTTATLKYGDEVIIISINKNWSNIKSLDGKITGWLPNSSLTKKKIKIEVASQNKASANATELALAGKGWNSGMEDVLKDSSSANYNYKIVDKVESYTVSDADAIAFIKEGGLYLEAAE